MKMKTKFSDIQNRFFKRQNSRHKITFEKNSKHVSSKLYHFENSKI